MVIKVITNSPYEPDFLEIVRAFYPHISIGEGEIVFISIDSGKVLLTYKNERDFREIDIANLSEIAQKSEIKRLAKIMLYDMLCKISGEKLPYGSLTGIRPTKLYHELLLSGIDAEKYFKNYLKVGNEAVNLIKTIVANQKGIYSKCENEIDLFINIPICVSRCSYCSFISAEYGKIKQWIKPYVEQLCREIADAKELIAKNSYKLRAVYVGGGTPTSLAEEEFGRVISALSGLNCVEYTLEAGRPDTITKEKLRLMADGGVNRISINPQTFNDKTLKIIGRNHTAQDTVKIFNMAKGFGFDINTDLIAMLPEETFDDFQLSVEKCLELNPQNITVHTLAMKRGSDLKVANYDNSSQELAQKMVEYSRDRIMGVGYAPYYMYKQKYMSGNLDNTGYALKGKECVYNIDIMEETHNILACGGGGISKRVYHSQNRLERLANPKGLDVYLAREKEILDAKRNFFDKK